MKPEAGESAPDFFGCNDLKRHEKETQPGEGELTDVLPTKGEAAVGNFRARNISESNHDHGHNPPGPKPDPDTEELGVGSERLQTDSTSTTPPPGTGPAIGTPQSLSFWTPTGAIVDDSFLDTWDMTIHRCQHCQRPFGTPSRLQDHQRTWHAKGSPEIPMYELPVLDSRRVDANRVTEITVGGDLFIKATRGGSYDYYQVSSQVLWTASSVFRAMFGPDSNFGDGLELRRSHIRGLPPVVIPLHDDSDALKFVFNVLHHRRDAIRYSSKGHFTADVAAVCMNYRLHEALKPIADRLYLVENASRSTSRDDLLVISHCFGYGKFFEAASLFLILHCKKDPVSGLVFREKPISRHLPQSVKRMISAQVLQISSNNSIRLFGRNS